MIASSALVLKYKIHSQIKLQIQLFIICKENENCSTFSMIYISQIVQSSALSNSIFVFSAYLQMSSTADDRLFKLTHHLESKNDNDNDNEDIDNTPDITLRVLPRFPLALASPSLSPMDLARVRSCL